MAKAAPKKKTALSTATRNKRGRPRRAPTNAGSTPTNAGSAPTNAGSTSAVPDTAHVHVPAFAAVALTPARRPGRRVENLDKALQKAEGRLRLAWHFRALLDPALPPGFHARAWTAYHALHDAPTPAGAATPSKGNAPEALEALRKRLQTLRSIVEPVTRPGDPERDALRFGTALQSTSALVPLGEKILEGARGLASSVPALTAAVLEDTARALRLAQTAVGKRRSDAVNASTDHALSADPHQLALDVLLECLEQLHSAAVSALRAAQPAVAARLEAPLEGSRAAPAAPPAPPAPSAPAK